MLAYLFVIQHLRGQVGQAPAESAAAILLSELFRKAKVGKLQVTILAHEHVLWFEITIDNIPRMEVLQGKEDLADDEGCFSLRDDLFFSDVLTKVTSRTIVHTHVQVRHCLKGIVKSYNERVVCGLKNFCLADGIFHSSLGSQSSFL